MAEVLSKSKLLFPSEGRSVSFSGMRRSNSLAGLHLTLSPSFQSLRFSSSSSFSSSIGNGGVALGDWSRRRPLERNAIDSLHAKMSLRIGKSVKWWEKGLQPNMKEVQSAQDLVDSLLNADNKLVIVDFYSPGCGGCKALHPKICQFAELNPDVLFLQVNYEEHKSMCYSLNVHVLPFFRFYRGAHGRLCSFSCTNATIKKFKDALAKHSTDRCSLGPAKGLEESELLSLAANKDLSVDYNKKPMPVPAPDDVAEATPISPMFSPTRVLKGSEDKVFSKVG
ncbi:Monodehydroascorbate reductase (NADH) protein [Dioscorea alata]|uniref:Monodehydroascorbate reductase (NADH) protein n=1 Tax=Dioscorea alata TaxID=55571 RepID=A0ACB7U6K7_DIOAL|nr:Monodehydroascorbate reductase (NADH) protein [Dioscorea alata]